MRKKKYLNILLLLAISIFSFVSCSEDTMDDINLNPNNPIDVESKFILTDVMTSSAFNITGADYAFYAACYIEHKVGIYGQMYNAEKRTSGPASSTTYNGEWNSSYRNIFRTNIVIDKCSVGGLEEGNYHTLAIAQILKAYNAAVLTDLMGDTPFTEACQPGVIFTPKLDTQKSIYDAVFKLLNDAIVNLDKTSLFPSIASQDLIYKGNTDSWKKFAYGLLARYTMRLSKVAPNYDKVIEYANKSFNSAAEQCVYNYDGKNAKNPLYSFFNDRDYLGSSKSLKAKIDARVDPRDPLFFVIYPKAVNVLYAENGNPDQIQEKYGLSGLINKTAPTYLLSYHELQFLKAEAYMRKTGMNTEAETALKAGVSAAFVKVGLTVSAANTYYTAQVKAKFTADMLGEIMNQKYLAFYDDESIEAYNDIRRWKAMGDNKIILAHPLVAKFPLRYTYGSSDVTTNPNVRGAYGDGSYVYTENVWWAGGTR
ncbi:MAG: SusD/RagB family nutrient-binding outer membrane lipoprotein [Marinifilaceae bacterium]